MAVSVTGPIATGLEVDRTVHAPTTGLRDSITGLVGPAQYLKSPAAELPHLGHEQQALDGAIRIEGGEALDTPEGRRLSFRAVAEDGRPAIDDGLLLLGPSR